MPDNARVHSWQVVFNKGRFSEVYNGQESSRDTALVTLLQQARAIRAARESQFAPYVVLGIGTGQFDENRLFIPMHDLDLDDAVLIERIDADIAITVAREQARQRQLTEAAQPSPVLYPVPDAPFAEQWARLLRWLQSNAPTSVPTGPKTSPEAIADAQTLVGFDWPAALVEFFHLNSGSGQLVPEGPFLSLDQMLDERTRLLDMWATLVSGESGEDPFEARLSRTEPAGSPAYTFIDAFIPIAGERDFIVMDLRAGPLHGCLSRYNGEGDSGGAGWLSLGAMLSDVAQSLESGRTFAGVWVPQVVDDALVWDAP